MEIIFLGTGTSTGVPMLACSCPICRSNHPKNKRLRSSIVVSHQGFNILVDTSTDLRQQCISNNIQKIDAICFTHHHADHILGFEELRSFNFIHKTSIPCYGREDTFGEIKRTFHYIFDNQSSYKGTLSQVTFHPLQYKSLLIGGIEVSPLEIIHGNMVIAGYKFNQSAYITDCSRIPEGSKSQLYELDVLILNALRYEPHPTHFNLEEALKTVSELKPKRAIFTHMSHQIDYETVNRNLPEGVELAYDGMRIIVRN